jgi:hypothetical protein
LLKVTTLRLTQKSQYLQWLGLQHYGVIVAIVVRLWRKLWRYDKPLLFMMFFQAAAAGFWCASRGAVAATERAKP